MRWPAVAIAITVMGVSLRGAADGSAADKAIAEAQARAKANDFLGAAAKYREAYAADPRASLICNIGIAYFKAKSELPRAQLFLSRCYERGTGFDAAKDGDNLRAVLGVVETGLRAGDYTPVDVAVEPATATVAIDTFAPDETFPGSRVIWLPRGTHHVTATAEGFVARTVTVEATAKTQQTLRIVLDRTPPPVEPGAGSGSGGSSAAVTPPPPVVPPKPPATEVRTVHRSKLPAIGATVGTALFIVGAIYSKGRAQDGADVAPFAVSHDAYERDKDEIETWNTRMVISASLALVGAGASGYLWYRALNSPTQKIEITPTDRGASVSLTRRF